MNIEEYKNLMDNFNEPKNDKDDWFDEDSASEHGDDDWFEDKDALSDDDHDDEDDEKSEDSEDEDDSKKLKKNKKNEDFGGLWASIKLGENSNEEDFHSEETGMKNTFKDNFASSNERLVQSFSDYRQVKIKIASPKEIKKLSHGEIQNSETLNYRTLKSEFGGLFCERIFGPNRSFECACGCLGTH